MNGQSPPIRATIALRWQMPTLLLGSMFLLLALFRLAINHQPIGFHEQLGKVRQLREVGALARAHAYLLYLLKGQDRPAEERAELHRLLAETLYQAEAAASSHDSRNLRAAISNYRTAFQLGAVPQAEEWVRWARIQEWLDAPEEAVEAYRTALRLLPQRPDRIRRRLVSLLSADGKAENPESLASLDAILEDEGASPDNYLWALERKTKWLLDQDDAESALAVVETGKTRLSGTSHRLALSYSEASCLVQAGNLARAEGLLRTLRDNWKEHDQLWGKAGWLLGRIQQEDGRPQVALSYYEDVLAAFVTGDLHDACELGRAQCMAALERYDRALEIYARLRDRTAASYSNELIDLDALRTEVATIGESRMQQGDTRVALQFLEMALAMASGEDGPSKARLISRIAAGLVEWAREQRASTESAGRGSEVESLYLKAAESYLSLVELRVLSEDETIQALEFAAEYFDSAGRTERMIETLNRIVQEHPASSNRAFALHRLGRAYQAEYDYPAAAAAYRRAIEEYPRLPDALASMAPLADCLLNMGDEHAAEGVNRLLDIVDDRGPDPLFSPQASEYRQALFRLAEYYVSASEAEAPGHFERAVARLEDALALYPDDPLVPRLRFQLAESYRVSAQQIRTNDAAMLSRSVQREVDRRVRAALTNYRLVKAMLARHDASSLSSLEETYLRNSYLYEGDCLFDLNALEPAVDAYREAAWRYENDPAAVSASLQVVHCYQRLGRAAEARAALARLQWLLKKIPESSFDAQRGMSPKKYWEQMAARIERANLF